MSTSARTVARPTGSTWRDTVTPTTRYCAGATAAPRPRISGSFRMPAKGDPSPVPKRAVAKNATAAATAGTPTRAARPPKPLRSIRLPTNSTPQRTPTCHIIVPPDTSSGGSEASLFSMSGTCDWNSLRGVAVIITTKSVRIIGLTNAVDSTDMSDTGASSEALGISVDVALLLAVGGSLRRAGKVATKNAVQASITAAPTPKYLPEATSAELR
mmetsp:Transcript_30092/g.78982  ORF Transcript_30092/g.78982 Transcript_30092/m.78982 type:complete len:214 (-) Transcript_30092:435-1076(-)